MALVIVERAFEAARDFSELQALETAAAGCLATYRVRFLRTLFALDRRRMVCFYEAPDAESVRVTQKTAGLPVEHVWTATAMRDTDPAIPTGFSLVVAQRNNPDRFDIDGVRHALTDPTGCGGRLRLTHFGAFLALDGQRMICTYTSPDVESVRVASRETGTPLERAWAAELIRPPA